MTSPYTTAFGSVQRVAIYWFAVFGIGTTVSSSACGSVAAGRG